MKSGRIIFSLVVLLTLATRSLPSRGDDQRDSLVFLLSSQSVQAVDSEGSRYRKVIGPARFLHNNTYLICDTAYWNVETRVINAWGNVSILQEETVLKGDHLTYIIDEDLAQFRGTLVQLEDKDHNMLRTRHLDYNTKDSVAVFRDGGSMRDKDGQIIESRYGTYESKIKTFTFEQDVNMFSDSIFVKTGKLKYQSDRNMAHFFSGTDAWKDDDMLSATDGWYDRSRELFFFTRNVHVLSTDQEGWCDSLYFKRMTSDVEMLGNAQVSDTTRNVYALAGRIEYLDTLSQVTMTRSPAVITRTEDNSGVVDTVYVGAEKLVYQAIQRCDVDSSFVEDAKKRLKDLDVDPVGTFRKKAAEEAARAAEEQAKNDPNYRPQKPKSSNRPASATDEGKPASGRPGMDRPMGDRPSGNRPGAGRPGSGMYGVDSLSVSDSLSVPGSMSVTDSLFVRDSLSASDSLSVSDSLFVTDSLSVADSIAVRETKDTTKIGFLSALKNVKIFRKDLQVACDSLVYCDLDSLARLFENPIVWQDGTRQYAADSITLVIRNSTLEKASLMSNSFVTIQEDSTHFDQIKGAEMLAFFDSNGGLERFDVLGGASAVFFLEENDCLATVNKSESKMLSAIFSNGEIQKVYYFDQAKNDGYPVVQLSIDEQRLKGFLWNPQRRPKDRSDVTTLSLRPSQRTSYRARPRARFIQTDIYFPGYMKDVYRRIQMMDSINALRALAPVDPIPSESPQDSLSQTAGQMFDRQEGQVASTQEGQQDGYQEGRQEGVQPADSTLAAVPKVDFLPEKVKTKAELKAERKAMKKLEAEQKRATREKALEEKWKLLDEKDAVKASAKQEKKLQKLRKKKRKAYLDLMEQERKDAELLEKYIEKYSSRKDRK